MSESKVEKAASMANEMLDMLTKFSGEPDTCPHQIIQAIGSAFWTYVMMASRPETIQENTKNALDFMKHGADETLARAEDVYWKYYAKTNGVGNA